MKSTVQRYIDLRYKLITVEGRLFVKTNATQYNFSFKLI